MIPLNTSYPNPNRNSIRSRACYPWFRQGFSSPILYSIWSWPNYIPAQGRAQRSQLVSYYPSRHIYTSCGHCGWKGTDVIYSSQGFIETVGSISQFNQSLRYTGCGRYHGRAHFDRNSSWMNMHNDNRLHHPTGPAYCQVIYLRSNPVTTHVTRQLNSTFIQPNSTSTHIVNNARNHRDSVALDPPVPPLLRPDIIDADEAYHHFNYPFETQELDDNPESTSGENSPQAEHQLSSTTKCACYYCTDTDMHFCDGSSDQSDIDSASTYATGDGWNSPISPSYVSVGPADSNSWNSNRGNEFFGNYQDPRFCQSTSSPTTCWSKPQEFRQRPPARFQQPALVPPQLYQRPMSEYGPNPKVLCQQQNYIGYQYVSGQYIQVQNNATINQQSVPYGTPLQLEIPEVSFVQRSTNGQMLERNYQQSTQMQDFHRGEDWNSNQMLLKICPDNTPPIPRNSVPEVWEQQYEQLPNYDDLRMPGSSRVSRYFPTVPVEYAAETYSNETKNTTTTFSACTNPGIFQSNALPLSFTTIQQRSTVSVHQSKYIAHQVPYIQQQASAGLLAGGGIHHVNEIRHDSIGRWSSGRLDFEEMHDRRSISLTSFRNYYDTHNQPDGVAGNSSTRTYSSTNRNVRGTASKVTRQRARPQSEPRSTRGFSGNPQRQQNGRGAERDSDVSNITLRTLLETPYSPRTRNEPNLELEEYQRMLAEEELQKQLDALKAKETGDKMEGNGNTNTTMETENAEDENKV